MIDNQEERKKNDTSKACIEVYDNLIRHSEGMLEYMQELEEDEKRER